MVYRVLSLDGGGIRGILSAQILVALEEMIDQPLHEYFNLVTGTSTGSILATAIATGRRAADLVALYELNGKRIFPYSGKWGYLAPQRLKLVLSSGLSAPKFANDGLKAVLKEQFRDRGSELKLSDVSPKSAPCLMIPAYDTLGRTPTFFKSWREEWYKDLYLWEICVCSAAAPTFFPAYELHASRFEDNEERSMVDGGIAANNPAASAVAEAVRLGNKLEDIVVLSIGTGDFAKPLPYQKVKGWGVLQWAGHLVDVFMDGPLDVNHYISKELLPDRNYQRLNPVMDARKISETLLRDAKLRHEVANQFSRSEREALSESLARHKVDSLRSMDDASNYNLQLLKAAAKIYLRHWGGYQQLRDFVAVGEGWNC